jgi:hypothetical protein
MTKRLLFIAVAIILAAAGFYARSRNAQTAHTQANQLVRQDASGTDTTAALAALKDYVASHMGASADFTLAAAYARATAAAQAAAAASAANSQISAQAQAHCAGKSDSITQARCNQAYLAQHLSNVPPPAPVAAPKAADYHYTLRAPVWTPDLAGALLLGSVIALAIATFGRWRRRR